MLSDVLSLTAIVGGGLMLIAIAAVIAYNEGCRYADRKARRLQAKLSLAEADVDDLAAQVDDLANQVAMLQSTVDRNATTCASWHDLVGIHRNALTSLTKRVDALEDAGVLPPVEPVGSLLFAETVRDRLLPTLRVDTRFDREPLAIGSAAPVGPADNTETGFTRDDATAVNAIAGELIPNA